MLFDVFRQIAADFPNWPWWVCAATGFPVGALAGYLKFRWKLTQFQGCSLAVLLSLLWSVYWSAWRWL